MVAQLRRLHILAVMAEKGTGSILNGILHLKQKVIKFTAKSVHLKSELGKYKFIEGQDGEATNKPIDDYNHLIDSTRMAIFSHRNRVKH
jgi:phage terminase large subunit